jgi:hypothetical protein
MFPVQLELDLDRDTDSDAGYGEENKGNNHELETSQELYERHG